MSLSTDPDLEKMEVVFAQLALSRSDHLEGADVLLPLDERWSRLELPGFENLELLQKFEFTDYSEHRGGLLKWIVTVPEGQLGRFPRRFALRYAFRSAVLGELASSGVSPKDELRRYAEAYLRTDLGLASGGAKPLGWCRILLISAGGSLEDIFGT